MKEILKKKLNKKGFTLAELLIVVAIIAVLVAIAIPVFGGQLDKAKKAVDDANIRSAYAQYTIDAMFDKADAGAAVTPDQATGAEAAAAFAAIDVEKLEYYAGISMPKDGGRWTGTGTGGAASITDTICVPAS